MTASVSAIFNNSGSPAVGGLAAEIGGTWQQDESFSVGVVTGGHAVNTNGDTARWGNTTNMPGLTGMVRARGRIDTSGRYVKIFSHGDFGDAGKFALVVQESAWSLVSINGSTTVQTTLATGSCSYALGAPIKFEMRYSGSSPTTLRAFLEGVEVTNSSTPPTSSEASPNGRLGKVGFEIRQSAIDWIIVGDVGDPDPEAAGDTTAPTLSSPTGAGGTATGTGGITSNEAGTHYWQATTSATPLTIPTAPAAMTGWTSRSLTATAQTWSLSTLAAGTYYVHSAAEDAAGNRTTTDVVSASFVVAAGTTLVAFTGTVPAQIGTVSTASTDLALASYFSGTQTPFAYTVFSGALPGGLSLNSSTGAITGTPTTAGSYSAVIRATDASSNTANTGTISWTIAAGLATTFTFTMTGAVSLTGLKYAIFEGVTPDVWVAPILKGANETTDASGVCTVSVTGLTTKLIGQLGSAFVTNSDGSASGGAQSATRRAAYYVGVFS